MPFNADNVIRILTMTSLSGLLFTTGLRLTWPEIVNAFRTSRFAWILPVNFIVVPALTLGIARLFHFPADVAIGMMLLGAAPFAPVVPVFTKMARGDIASAGVLTALFPLFSAYLTPIVCEFALRPYLGNGKLEFSFLTILGVLAGTITLPLVAGVAFTYWLPKLGPKLVKPFDIFSEAAGAVSLGFVSYVEFPLVRQTSWNVLIAMAIIFEISFFLGYLAGGKNIGARRVVALGTSNRNIALALLVGIESFPGTPVLASVVANGLLLIFLGLLHVAYWQFLARNGHEKAQKAQKQIL